MNRLALALRVLLFGDCGHTDEIRWLMDERRDHLDAIRVLTNQSDGGAPDVAESPSVVSSALPVVRQEAPTPPASVSSSGETSRRAPAAGSALDMRTPLATRIRAAHQAQQSRYRSP